MSVIDPPNPGDHAPAVAGSTWSARYGERHRLVRITDFPPGIAGPKKVRLYRRLDHYVLQWWDPQAKANLSDRVDGDLVAAIVRARQIEERLSTARRGGVGVRRLGHADLVERFLAELGRRADAGAAAPATAGRYRSALARYLAYCQSPGVLKSHPHAATVDRDFRLGFAAFLAARQVSPNGHANAAPRPLKGQAFVLDAARALFEWAADPDCGGLLPDGFRNPFRRSGERRSPQQGDPLAEPDVTLPMAIDFVGACDAYQLRLFAPLLLFGLRAAEPCLLFAEYLDGQWLRVPCNPELDYQTKGRRDKRFPLIEDLEPLWGLLRDGREHGLLYERRAVVTGKEKAPGAALRWNRSSGSSASAAVRRGRRRWRTGSRSVTGCCARPGGSATTTSRESLLPWRGNWAGPGRPPRRTSATCSAR
jgi:hypothetical protein